MLLLVEFERQQKTKHEGVQKSRGYSDGLQDAEGLPVRGPQRSTSRSESSLPLRPVRRIRVAPFGVRSALVVMPLSGSVDAAEGSLRCPGGRVCREITLPSRSVRVTVTEPSGPRWDSVVMPVFGLRELTQVSRDGSVSAVGVGTGLGFGFLLGSSPGSAQGGRGSAGSDLGVWPMRSRR